MIFDDGQPEQFRNGINKKRDRIDESLAKKMLAQQLSNAERVARAHDIIENRNASTDLESRVAELHEFYLELAGN